MTVFLRAVGRQQRVSTVSKSSTDQGTVEEVYAVQAKPFLWLPSVRPHEVHSFDGEVNDSGGAEAALQAILTDHQGRRRRESAPGNMAPTTADLKHLQSRIALLSMELFHDANQLPDDCCTSKHETESCENEPVVNWICLHLCVTPTFCIFFVFKI